MWLMTLDREIKCHVLVGSCAKTYPNDSRSVALSVDHDVVIDSREKIK